MHPPRPDDDLVLPEPEVLLPSALRGLEWPFSRWETLALAALYVLPFVISQLVKP